MVTSSRNAWSSTRDSEQPAAGPAGGQQRGWKDLTFECRDLRVELRSSEGPVCVCKSINFDVTEGEFVSIMGRSGSGKTTLLKVLGGLLAPASGSIVRCHGEQVDGPPEGVITVFQNYAASLLPWRTVERNVALGLEGKVSKEEQRERVAEALEMVGLASRAKEHPWRLSGGMQQRVQLARALAMRPSVLLMDEPFGALDSMTKTSLQDELLQVYDRTGATIVFVTHDVDEALYLSDRVLILQDDPSTIGKSFTVECPRPRDQFETKQSEGFQALRREVHEAIMRPGG